MLKPGKTILRGLKNASYLTIGTIISQAIGLVGFIYIARLLGPENYGIYVTVGVFVGMFSLVTLTGLNKVILREGAKDLSQMGEYLEKTTGTKNLFAFIAIIICICSSFFTSYSMQLRLYIALFSFDLLYSSFSGFFGIVYQAAEKMQYNAVLQILNRIIFVPLAVTFLYMGYGLLTLFLIALFSHFFTLIINFKLTKKFVIFKFWNKIAWDKQILKPALIFSILGFTGFLATRIDLVMISLLCSLEDVGIYAVAYTIAQQGSMIRNIIATAFFPIFVKIFHDRTVSWKRLLKYSFGMGVAILIGATIFSFYSEQIITLLFGDAYRESGVILGVLIFYLSIEFFSIPFTNALQATHNENVLLKIAWIAPTLNIGLNYLFLIKFGLIGIAYSTLVVTFVNIFVYIILTYRILKRQNKIN